MPRPSHRGANGSHRRWTPQAPALVAPGEVEVLDLLAGWSVAATRGEALPPPAWDLTRSQRRSGMRFWSWAAIGGTRNIQRAVCSRHGPAEPDLDRLAINWHGDWTMIPGRHEPGAAIGKPMPIFVFGGDNDGMLHDSLLWWTLQSFLAWTGNGNDASSAGEGAASLPEDIEWLVFE